MRLNTGGELASPQEIRNCTLVWINEKLYDWLEGLGKDEHFVSATSISERLLQEKYDLELALRFVVFRRMPEDQLRDLGHIGDFLDKKTVELALDKRFDMNVEGKAFRTTFAILDNALGSDCFRKFDKERERFRGAFLISAFEAVALGLGYHVNQLVKKSPDWIAERVRRLWDNSDFLDSSGMGVPARTRIQKSVPIGRQLFEP